MAILPVKLLCSITIITIGAPIVLLAVVGHGGCCNIFGILNNRLISDPFWKIVCVLLGWVPTRVSSLWPTVFLYRALLTTLVTSQIWLDRWPSSIDTNIYTEAALEVNLIQRLVDRLLNDHSVCLWKWRLFLRLILVGIRLPQLWIGKIEVFTRILLYKGKIGDELLWWYDIYVTHTKFIYKLRNLLVLMNPPKT